MEPEATLSASAGTDLPAKVTVEDSVVFFDELAGMPGQMPGEVQSTVIAPNQNSQCPEGRLLISNDQAKSPAAVRTVSLANLSGPTSDVTPEDPPSLGLHRRIQSNDHDLVTLPGGEVLLVKMGQAKYGKVEEPVWFDYAYKLTYKDGVLTDIWGPGARSEILVWQSTDCGKTFKWVSSIDTADVDDGYGTPDDGSGGLPQGNVEMFALIPGNLGPKWQMGGTDGPQVRVDPDTGDVLITIGLVGQQPEDDDADDGFWLSDIPLKRSVVMRSSDKGSSWQQAASLPFPGWRIDVVPQSGGKMVIGHNGWNEAAKEGYAFVTGPLDNGFTWPYGAPFGVYAAPDKTARWGWEGTHTLLDKNDGSMAVNISGQTILTRSPSSQNLVLAYKDAMPLPGGFLDHYKVYVYNGQSNWLPLAPILPSGPHPENFVLHPTAVDPGQGPLLFYWYDVDYTTKRATIRGRLITRDDAETVNFAISRTSQIETAFDVSPKLWYGDYHTAGAYWVQSTSSTDWQHAAYHYYPIWVQPDGIHVAHLSFNVPLTTKFDLVDLPGPMTYQNLTVQRVRIDATQLTIQRTEEEEEESRRPTPPR
jgi:hypothetical protein